MSNHNRREFLSALALAGGVAGGLGRLKAEALSATEKRRPNILLFFPDQHRFDWIGSTPGLPVRTPNLDQMGRHGVRFTRALTPSPLCAPARACLASGKEYARCGVRNNGFNYPLNQTTFYSLLRDSGYWTMACGKLDLNKPDNNTGLDGKRYLKQWGFTDGINNLGKLDAVNHGAVTPTDPYMAYLHKRGLAAAYVAYMNKLRHGHHADIEPSPLPDEAYCDNWIARNGLELLGRSPKDKPWFLMINFAGPHDPQNVTRRMWDRWKGVRFPQPNGTDGLSEEANNIVRRCYSAMVENIDRWVGIYLDELKKRGELENTLVVYSSDHGEMLGDHGRWGKWVPYQPSVGVPLILAGPGVEETGASDALVSTMDLAATFLDYGGVERPADMDSRSFRTLLEGKTRHHRDWLLSGLDLWRLSYDGHYKFVDRFDPTFPRRRKHLKPYSDAVRQRPPLLFDELKDPGENSPLVSFPQSQAEDENVGSSKDALCSPPLTRGAEFSG